MTCEIRKWELVDAADLAEAISNKKYKIISGMVCRILTRSRTEQSIFLQCFL